MTTTALTTSLVFRNVADNTIRFAVNVPGSAGNSIICWQPGTYTEHMDTDGNWLCEVEVAIKATSENDAAHDTARTSIERFLDHAAWLAANEPKNHSRVYLQDRYDTTSKRWARVLGGSLVAISNRGFTQWNRSVMLYLLSWTRAPKWNKEVEVSRTSGPGADPILFKHFMQPGAPRRITRFSVSHDNPGTPPAATGLEKVWAGFHDTNDNFDPTIDFSSADIFSANSSANTRRTIKIGETGGYSYDIDFAKGGTAKALRWAAPLKSWNGRMSPDTSAAKEARRNMAGRWLVLMRYNIKELATTEIDCQLFTFFENSPKQKLDEPAAAWIKPQELKGRPQTMELGYIEIGGDEFGYEENADMLLDQFCIGIDMEMYGDETDNPLIIDALILIPANRMIAAKVDDEFSNTKWFRDIDIYTDDLGRSNAYMVNPSGNDRIIVASIPDLTAESWMIPPNTGSYLVASTDGSYLYHADMSVTYDYFLSPSGARYL